MPGVKKMQDLKKLYKTDILIQVSDINYGGHLGNDRFLTLAQEARVRFFKFHGWSEKNLANTEMGIIVTEADIKFLKEGFLGQTIEVTLYLGKTSKCSFELFYELKIKDTGDKLGEIRTKQAFFNYETRKIGACPEFIQKIS